MTHYDMELYREKRAAIALYSDYQLVFRSLAFILSNAHQSPISYEYQRALIDDLLRRAEHPPIAPATTSPTDIITLLRASTEWGKLGAAMADVLEIIRDRER